MISKFSLKILVIIGLCLLLLPQIAFTQDGDWVENFDDPALPGWHHSEAFIVADGQLHVEAPGHGFYPAEWKNFQLDIRMRRLRGPGETLLVYRSSGDQSYILVLDSGWAVLQIEQAGRVEALASAGEFEMPLEQWLDLSLVTDEHRHTVFLNGQMLLAAEVEPNLPPGGIGIELLGEAITEFDNLQIAPIGEHNSSEDPDNGPPPRVDEPLIINLGEQQADVWVRTGGPLGGLGYDIRMKPENTNMMYVTDSWAGVFFSDDGGQTWEPSNNGIDARTGDSADAIPVFCLTIDPHNSDVIWIGTQHRRGIFKSTDAGRTWTRKDNGIIEDHGISFRGITVDPKDPNIVYAAAELSSWVWAGQEKPGREFDRTGGVVYRTTDGGNRWYEIWRGDNLARYVWVHPDNTNIVYISTGIFDREAANSDPVLGIPGGEGVLRSVDGGQTWTNINNGLNNLYVGSLFMHPYEPNVLLAGAGTIQYPEGSGVYITTDGGDHWQQTLSDVMIESVEFALDDPSIAYAGGAAGVYISRDGGFSWTQTSRSDGWGSDGVRAGFPIDFQVDPANAQRIFANNYGGGNFVSDDGGKTWEVASTGYTGAQTRAIVVDPTNPARVIAAARSGLFRSVDGGQTWQGLNRGFNFVLEWNALAINPANARQIIAANNWTNILLMSKDGGDTLAPINGTHIGPAAGWRAIAFAPSDPSVIYAGASAYRSAGSFSSDIPSVGVFVSRDGGRRWQSVSNGVMQDANVAQIAVDPFDADVVYAATYNHDLLKTDDGGQTWQELELGLRTSPPALSVAVQPIEPFAVFVGIVRAGLMASLDDGQTWQRVGIGLPPEASITSIVFDPTDPTIMYIADLGSGVYRSVDGGRTWAAYSKDLRMRAVNALSISSDGQYLYAATEGEGVYRVWTADRRP